MTWQACYGGLMPGEFLAQLSIQDCQPHSRECR